ncbi:MAG: MotA/TolQ/ExbB proton channel family protein [bacterium]
MTIRPARWILVIGMALAASGFFNQAVAQDAPAAPAAPAVAAAPAAGPAAAKPGQMVLEGTAPKQAESHNDMNFVTIVLRAGWFGAMIWAMLFAALGVGVWLIVDSYMTVREAKIAPQSLVEEVRLAMEQGDVLKAINVCDKNPCPLANVLKAGFANVEEGFDVIKDMIGIAADLESETVLQRVTYLSVISNATPMLGLIGTVQGMIFAFFNLGTTAAGAAQSSMLAVNISHGLWATAIGLGTSVPAMVYFFYFKNKAMRIILHMESQTMDLVKALRNVEVVAE